MLQLPERPLFERIASVTTRSPRRARGSNMALPACYNRSRLHQHPDERAFFGTRDSTAQEAFYSTILHELSHIRALRALNREKGKRFADRAYAFEELIAIVGGVLCGSLGSPMTRVRSRAVYAQYLAILKNDKKGLRAAAAASARRISFWRFSRKGQEEAAKRLY